MLTPAEIQTMQAAVDAAEREVLRLEQLAAASSSWPGLLFPTDEQRAARAGRATLRAIVEVRNAVVESGDHEEALRVIENANRLAERGRVAHAIERPPLTDAMKPGGPLEWLGKLLSRITLVGGIVLGLVALAVVAYFIAQVRALAPARR
jgi:hypothetical protein